MSCPPTTVVGVVGDVPYLGLAVAAEGMYSPLAQNGARSLNLVVRSRRGAAPALRSLRAAVAGSMAGLGIAAFESRWLGSLLYGVEASDPATLGAALVLILVVAASACWLPGLQAARINPLEVISGE